MIDVRTIGAGGGSIAWIDKGGLLRVGPQSAGANPGRRATDAAARADRHRRQSGARPLEPRLLPRRRALARRRCVRARALGAHGSTSWAWKLRRLRRRSSSSSTSTWSMPSACVSIDRGLDPAGVHARLLRRGRLATRGGARRDHRDPRGPRPDPSGRVLGVRTHDCRHASRRVASRRACARIRSASTDSTPSSSRLQQQALTRLRSEGYEGVAEAGGVCRNALPRTELHHRHPGRSSTPDGRSATPLDELYVHFHAEHRRLYGYDIPDEIIEFVNFKVAAVGPTENPSVREARNRWAGRAESETRCVLPRSMAVGTTRRCYERSTLPAERALEARPWSRSQWPTTLLHPGQTLDVDRFGNLLLRTSTSE